MRRLAALITMLLVLLSASSVEASRPLKGSQACSLPRDAHMVAADAQAQLYVRPERNGPHGTVLWPEAFGCVFGRTRTYSLGELAPPVGDGSEGSEGIELEMLGGPMVAYEYGVASPESSESLVVVRSLLTGRIIHRVPSNPFGSGKVRMGPLTTLVVKGDGAVAWIVESGFEEPSFANHFVRSKEYIVFALDKTGTRQLAVGKNIDPRSLGLVGSTLYWTQGGEPGSAALN